jgi:hypothetical protein
MVSKFEEKTAHVFYDTAFGDFVLQPLVIIGIPFVIGVGIGVGLLYLINLIW